jgi:hypothetical protein
MDTILKLVALGYYFFFHNSRAAFASPFDFWPWLVFGAYYVAQHYKEIWEDTCRVMAGVYLLKREGTVDDFHHRRLIRLLSSSPARRGLSWFVLVLSVTAFCALLFTEGWVIALVTWFLALVQPKPLPRPYQHHLAHLLNYLRTDVDPDRADAYLMITGDTLNDVTEVVAEAVREKKQPRKWAAEIAGK